MAGFASTPRRYTPDLMPSDSCSIFNNFPFSALLVSIVAHLLLCFIVANREGEEEISSFASLKVCNFSFSDVDSLTHSPQLTLQAATDPLQTSATREQTVILRRTFLLYTAMRFRPLVSMLKATAGGAFVTLSSTYVACLGAVYVERTAHRTLYRFFPHWYRDVEYANGLEPHLLEAVRTAKTETTYLQKEEATEWRQHDECFERNTLCADKAIFNIAMTA